MDERDARRQVPREHPEPGADLEHDVVGFERGEAPDHAEDVLVDEEVLAELPARRDADAFVSHVRRKAAVAFASIACSSTAASSPRASAREARV